MRRKRRESEPPSPRKKPSSKKRALDDDDVQASSPKKLRKPPKDDGDQYEAPPLQPSEVLSDCPSDVEEDILSRPDNGLRIRFKWDAPYGWGEAKIRRNAFKKEVLRDDRGVQVPKERTWLITCEDGEQMLVALNPEFGDFPEAQLVRGAAAVEGAEAPGRPLRPAGTYMNSFLFRLCSLRTAAAA